MNDAERIQAEVELMDQVFQEWFAENWPGGACIETTAGLYCAWIAAYQQGQDRGIDRGFNSAAKAAREAIEKAKGM